MTSAQKFQSISLALLLVGCNLFKKESINPTRLTSREDSIFCAVPQMSDFDSHLNDSEQKKTLQAALEQSKLKRDGKSLVGTTSDDSLTRWILFTLTPLSMGCQNYKAGGPQKYGQQAFANFVAVAADALRAETPAGITPIDVKLAQTSQLSNPQKKFIGTLVALNRRLRSDDKATFRVSGEDVIHGVPLTPQEELALKEISKEGLLKVVAYAQPFKNAIGDMVSGRFLSYPSGSEVVKHIVALSAQYEKALTKSDQEYKDDAARIMRRCISIHPFHDANGRTCTLTALWMQSQRKLPHSVLWSGEDILIKENEFILRYKNGIKFHEEFRKSLKD